MSDYPRTFDLDDAYDTPSILTQTVMAKRSRETDYEIKKAVAAREGKRMAIKQKKTLTGRGA